MRSEEEVMPKLKRKMNISLNLEYRDLKIEELEKLLFKLQEDSGGKIYLITKIPIKKIIKKIRRSFCLSEEQDCNCPRCRKIDKIIKKCPFTFL